MQAPFPVLPVFFGSEALLPSDAKRAGLIDGDSLIPVDVVDPDVSTLIRRVLNIELCAPVLSLKTNRSIDNIVGILLLAEATEQIVVGIAGVHVSGLNKPLIGEAVSS